MSFWTDYIASKKPDWWNADYWGQQWNTVIGGFFDMLDRAAIEAGEQHFPHSAAEDAIPYHGRERRIPRIRGSSLEDWRELIVDGWNVWVNSSSTAGYQELLRKYIAETTLTVFPAREWIGFDPPDEYDDDLDNWTRVFIVLPKPHRFTQPVVGPPLVVDRQQLVGISMTHDELQDFRFAARPFLGAYALPVELRVYFQNGLSAGDIQLDHNPPGANIAIPLYTNQIGQPWYNVVGPAMVVGQLYVEEDAR